MFRFLPLIALLLACQSTFGQAPNTQVFVFDFSVRDTSVVLTNPLYLTAFNQLGYNNQPGWMDRNNLLLSVQEAGMDQPDIYSFDLARKRRTRLTRTTAGEYSPRLIGAGQYFSAIRQENIGRDTVIRLWQFPMNRENNGEPVFANVPQMGYYQWLNSIQVAAFLVENPSRLVLMATNGGAARDLARNVGRCFKRQPNGNLVYVNKQQRPWRLVEQNLYRLNDPPRTITPTLEGSEDFAILPDGSFLMGRGSRLYRYDPIRYPRWIEVADLRLYGIQDITRLETNDFGRLALVAETTYR